MLLYLTPVLYHVREKRTAAVLQRHKEEEEQLLLLSSSSSTKPVTYALSYLNSPETAEQHASVFKQLFAFLELDGKDLDEQGLAFLNQVRRQSKKRMVHSG